MPRPPLPPVDAAQLRRVLAVVDDVLGDRVVAMALFGSATAGGLRPDSDLDVLVVVSSPLVGDDAERLVAGVLPVSGRRATAVPGRPVELTVVAWDDVVPWRFPARRQLQYGEWLREDAAAGRIAPPSDDPDLAILLRQALLSSVPLRGPELAAVLDPVPHEDVQRALDLTLPALLDDLVGDERNVLLTLARMWATRVTGEILPKDVAAEWASVQLDGACEVARTLSLARDGYLGLIDDDWSERHEEAAAAAAVLAGRVRSRN